jgi:flagellar biosynthetic protein FliQ
MTDAMVLQLAQDAITTALKISTPILGLSFAVGMSVSVFQAATQIQEQSLSFIPKLTALGAALIASGPWIIKTMVTYTTTLLANMNQYIK